MSINAFRPARLRFGGSRGHGQYRSQDLRRQFKELEGVIADFASHMTDMSPEVLKEAMAPTFALSQLYCPKDTGELVSSGFLEVEKGRKGAALAMGYARASSPHYAVYVHEVPMRHKDPTSWKFMQRALQEDGGNVQQRIIDGYRRAAGRVAK